MPDGSPVRIGATATVLDVNRQGWSGRADILVHPADLYVGLRSARHFVGRDEPMTVEAVVTDIDGNPIQGRSVVLRAARLDWSYLNGEWQEIEKEMQECTVETTAASSPDDTESEFAVCSFRTTFGGEYRISATVYDDAGRRSKTELKRWVSGGQRPPGGSLEMEQVRLIPDGDSYAPGDSAQILVQAPFYPAEGLAYLAARGSRLQ